MRRRRRTAPRAVRLARAAGVVLSGLASIGTLAGAPSSGAQQSQTAFTASATADLARVSVRVDPAVVVNPIADPGALTAQATVDSIGNSRAFAANPFPGTLVGDLPGLLAGAFGLPSLPNLVPTVVSSDHPLRPSARFGAGPLELRADSSLSTSTASAADGGNRSVVSVVNDPSSGEVVARAESIVAGVELAGLATISGYRSVSEIRRSATGEVESSTEFSISRLTILDQSFSITPDGVQLLGTSLPLPAAQARLTEILKQLSGEGVSIELLDPVITDESVTAPALVLNNTQQVEGVGKATVSTTLGRTTASLGSRPIEPFEPAELPPSSDGVTPSGPIDATLPPLGGGDLPSFGTSPAAAAGDGSAVSDLPPPVAEGPAMVDITDTTPLGSFYPVLFMAGGCIYLFSSAYHHFGEKLQWTS